MTNELLKSRLAVASATLLVGIGIGWVARDISSPPLVVTKNDTKPNAVRRSPSSNLSSAITSGESTGSESAPGGSSKTPSGEDMRRAEANGILKSLIAEMEKGKDVNYRKLFSTLARLHDSGPAGVAAIADYLHSGEDLVVGSASGRSMSLRSLLLNSMGDMPPSPELASLNLEILKSTPLIEEAVLAARNLQQMAPGQYLNDAAARVNSLLANMSSNNGSITGYDMQRELRYATQFASYTGSAETIALLSQQVNADPSMARMITSSLRNFPADTQAATLAAMESNPAATKEIAANSRALTRLDLSNNAVRGSVADLFLNQMDDHARENFLETIARPDQGGSYRDSSSHWNIFRDLGTAQPQSAAAKPAQNQATLQLLDQISAAILTPVLQQRYTEARQALTTAPVTR